MYYQIIALMDTVKKLGRGWKLLIASSKRNSKKMSNEIWKESFEFPNYELSNTGKIRRIKNGKELKIASDLAFYDVVRLFYNKKKYTIIHRLIALQYMENPDNLPQIDHIDRNKRNNNLDNLRWCSQHTNRLNRTDLISLKTEDELLERTIKLREYKKLKAREYTAKKKALKNI